MRLIIPRATYRLQLNAQFTFRHAIEIIPYLRALGVSHVYCSPYFRARPGSQHGYDVVDHNSFNPEIGTREEFEEFVATLRAHDMGHILDIVPNHVGIMGADNAGWMDVLENGEAALHASYFDIDWTPANPTLAHKILVPVLGEPYGIVLERGEFELRFEADQGSFAVFFHEHRLPLDPQTYPRVLDRALAHSSHPELGALRRAFDALPSRIDTVLSQRRERDEAQRALKQRLAALSAANPQVSTAIRAGIQSLAGEPGSSASFDALHELLERQVYRLAFWRVASDEINYRRFFDVNDLAALRIDRQEVFEETHQLVFELIRQGKLDGLRIDHPDGLFDPAQYFLRLQHGLAQSAGEPNFGLAGTDRRLPVYLVVEKITPSFEELPASWPVHGETGYHFANVANRLLVDPASEASMTAVYQSFTADYRDWTTHAYDAQHMVLRQSLASELNVVANRLMRIAQTDRRTRDFTLNSVRQALAEVIACFPVYRTYIAESISAEDRRYIHSAVAVAKSRRGPVAAPVLDFISAALLSELPETSDQTSRQLRQFAMKFQQVTAPVTAKGIEDTALYRFNRLVSLNEVGAEPDSYGSSIQAFHADAAHRARYWPHEMLATSTHDTKRSGDVRARINVLSEVVPEWGQALQRWARLNESQRHELQGRLAPSRSAEYLLYQTLIGTWPVSDLDEDGMAQYRERICAYMIKAAREAKESSSWASVNVEYEECLSQFIRSILDARESAAFLTDFHAFQQRILRAGLLNGLTQTLCKLTAPGVPDIYQGDDLWDFSLVDPDNRRPVEYQQRAAILTGLQSDTATAAPRTFARALAEHLPDGRAKLYVIWKALQLRQTQEALFTHGDYLPLVVTGAHAERVCAFARRHAGAVAIAVAPRLRLSMLEDSAGSSPGAPDWGDTAIELPEDLSVAQPLVNVFDGERMSPATAGPRRALFLEKLLGDFPVALLTNKPFDARGPRELQG